MKTYVVSGAAAGIGAATAQLLGNEGHRVITVDLHDGPTSPPTWRTPEGRSAAVAGVQALTDVVHGSCPPRGSPAAPAYRPSCWCR